MTELTDEALALRIFEGVCALRVDQLMDAQLVREALEAFASPGRAAELVTRFLSPTRERVLARLATATEPPVKVGDAIPAGVLEMVMAILPSLPPPPRPLVESVIGSAEVRQEVRRLLEATVREALSKITGRSDRAPRGVLGWGARAATAAGRNMVGVIGGALGADLEGKVGEAVELGVSLAQKRLVELVASKDSSHRLGKELARMVPRLAELNEAEVAGGIARAPFHMLDGLVASLIAHNLARPSVRALVVDEAAATIATLSETTIGQLLERLGARAALRAATQRHGAAVVAAIRAHMQSGNWQPGDL